MFCRTVKLAIFRGLFLPQWDPLNFYVSSGAGEGKSELCFYFKYFSLYIVIFVDLFKINYYMLEIAIPL